MRLFWQREPKPDQSLIGTVQRIEKELATHTAAFREYAATTDIRLELIDVLTSKVLPQLSRALTESAESNRILAETQSKLNDTFERIIAALPAQSPHGTMPDHHIPVVPMREGF